MHEHIVPAEINGIVQRFPAYCSIGLLGHVDGATSMHTYIYA